MANEQPGVYRMVKVIGLAAGSVGFLSGANQAVAIPNIDGVAAGDASSNDVVLWTRATDGASSNPISLTAQLSTTPDFSSIAFSYTNSTDLNRDNILKINPTGLAAGQQYYYRFVAPGTTSATGVFKTAPLATTAAPLHFGFTGDADTHWRPYPSLNNFGTNKLDFAVFLGDTIYETGTSSSLTGIKNSPAVIDTTKASNVTNVPQILADYRRKYREQLQPVNPGGQTGLQQFFAAQGNYTLLDNHELGNKQLINGGAQQGATIGLGVSGSNRAEDVNTTGAYLNQVPAFKAMQQAYSDYQPIKEKTVVAPGDSRSNGSQQLYYAQQWGRNATYINLDDRSYRDVRLKTPGGADDTNNYGDGSRADNANRTMLGQTQLDWFKQTLLAAETAGTKWKIISVSSPIDQIGAVPTGTNGATGLDGRKSWLGGYRKERNDLLKFIDDNKITNVVFLTTDDHQNRINELTYQTTFGNTNTSKILPGAFTIVDGPLGAGGPDTITDHSYSNIVSLTNSLVASQNAAGIEPVGLSANNISGLKVLYRDQNPNAATDPIAPVDFYSPDTFNYNTLDISPDGSVLTVTSYGINSYASESFPEPSSANPVRELFSFSVNSVPEPASLALISFVGWTAMARRRRAH
jgi:phosphodiesterase/alkaline phosphatase D-like protein